MSRSYKHTAIAKDKNCKFNKRLSVRKIRRCNNISNGSQYKKYFCSWNICDYRYFEGSFTYCLSDWKNIWKNSKHLQKKWPTWKQAYRYWICYYKFK